MTRIVLAAALTLSATMAQAADLSPVAQKIYDKLAAQPDIGTVCQDNDKLRDDVRATVRSMILSGEVQGTPRDDARAAGRKIHANCASFKH